MFTIIVAPFIISLASGYSSVFGEHPTHPTWNWRSRLYTTLELVPPCQRIRWCPLAVKGVTLYPMEAIMHNKLTRSFLINGVTCVVAVTGGGLSGSLSTFCRFVTSGNGKQHCENNTLESDAAG